MSLTFLIGRAGSGKSEQMLKEIREELLNDPSGPPLIYLVPDQMKFQAERALLREDLPGMIRAQVYSFRRFAQRIFTEMGGSTKQPITRLGVKLLLYQALYRHKEQLTLFRQGAEEAGFGDALEELFIEFRRYGVSPEEVERLSSSISGDERSGVLKDKLSDFSIIYRDVLSRLEGKYLDSEETLRMLAEKIPHYAPLREAKVWVDGFLRFTPQEMSVLGALLTTVKEIRIALPVDEGDLFQTPALTMERLGTLARKAGVPVYLEKRDGYVRSGKEALRFLADHYEDRGAPPFPSQPEGLSVAEAVNRRAEVESVAQRIRELVREGKARWREILVLTGDLSIYEPYIDTLFTDYEIPYFLDERRPMLHHPLVELIRSTLEVLRDGWQSEALFRMIKTDLFPGGKRKEGGERERNRYDRLENFILEYGITGMRWKEEVWGISSPPERVIRMEALRRRIADPLIALEKEMNKGNSVKEILTALYRFLIEIKVPERLEAWMEEALEAGRPEEARSHEQVWQAYLALMDQMVETFGTEEIDREMLFALIERGLMEQNYALIPPAIDQVMVGTVARTRAYPPKVLFLMGVNEGLIPGTPGDQGLLYDDERKRIAEAGVLLSPLVEERMLEEELLLYLAVTLPTEELNLSYALADEEGRALTPSSFIPRIKRLFPQIQFLLYSNSPGKMEDEFSFVTHPRRTLSFLASRLRDWRRGYPISPLWFYVYHWYLGSPDWKEEMDRILESLHFRNQEERLDRRTAKRLYGNPIRGSISRLETFYACPFSHFASYGLGLKERKRFGLQLADIGTLYHDALHLIALQLKEEGTDWGKIELDKLVKLADQSVEEVILREERNQIFSSSNRYRYLKRRLMRVIRQTASILKKHGERSAFLTREVELSFGEKGGLPPISIPLEEGIQMELTGRVDRIDVAELNGKRFFRILDYKSSPHAVDLGAVYYGLSLQLFTYLHALLTLSPKWLDVKATPAGILYFHVHLPLLSLPLGSPAEKIERERLKRYRMSGFLLDDVNVVRSMDKELQQGHSEIIPVGLKKGEKEFYAGSKVIPLEMLKRIGEHVYELIRRGGEEILAGQVVISPYQYGKKTACTFCKYRQVCQFDRQLEGNEPRLLRQRKESEWLIRLEEGQAHFLNGSKEAEDKDFSGERG